MLRKRSMMVFGAAALVLGCGGAVDRAVAEEKAPVVFEVRADTPVVESRGGQRVIVRALVRPDGRRVFSRAPLAVAIVLDKSGSMDADAKMENAKLGALEALNFLDPRDIVTVVAYDDLVTVLTAPRKVGDGADDPSLARAIRRLRPGGSTALYDGVATGAAQLRAFVEQGYIPRIVLLSDGIANVGPSSTEALATLGRKLARQEMTITTIGLGLDYNEDLMTAVAASSGGNAYFARHSEMLPEIFARDMKDAVEVTARKVRITLRCPEGVRPVRVVGRPGTLRGNTLETSIDNLYGTGEKYALFEVELNGRDAGTSFEAAELELEYTDVATGAVRREQSNVRVSFSKDAADVDRNRDRDVAAQTELARNAEIREEAIRLVDEGRAKDATKLLEKRKSDLRSIAPSVGQAAPMIEAEAGVFDKLAQSIAATGGMSSGERKQTMNDAYMQKNQQAPLTISDDVSGDQQ